MRVINEISSLTDTLRAYKFENKIIGLVPTMGALHNGHLKLIDKAKEECDIVVCSIYVNPTQFNNSTDLEKYPRTIENDLYLLEKCNCDITFFPSDGEMYNDEARINFDFGKLGKVLEGEFRPGHFNGVGLIVAKFFNIVQPDFAYFGQKDLQQVAIINVLIKSLNYKIQLKCVPTVRNKQGLALSSRNMRLSDEGRQKALTFYNALTFAQKKMHEGAPVDSISNEVRTLFKEKGIELEYFEIVNKDTFEEISATEEQKNIAICIAGYLEGVRLIDNMLLN